jgi:hypothetical protein
MSYVSRVTSELDTEIRGRNPALTGQKHEIYMFIKDHPGCTRGDVSRYTKIKSSTCTARIKDLIDLGFVAASKQRRTKDKSGISVETLYALDDALHKKPRDKVLVTVKLFVDEAGRYHAAAKVLGELPVSGVLHSVMEKDVTVYAPYASEYKYKFMDDPAAEVPVSDTLRNVDLIVDMS